MAIYPRHKKAKILRDYMIQTNTENMFKEEEKEDTIYFRTMFPMAGEKKQVVLNVNDNVYLGFQTLLAQGVPEEKNAELLAFLNQCNLELPTVKYVITKDQCVIVSMFFTAEEEHLNPKMVLSATVQILKTIEEKQYSRLKEILGE